MAKHAVEPGVRHPLGAVPDENGVNFSLFSRYAEAVELLLFNSHDDVEPHQVIRYQPEENRSFYFWHCYVKGLKPGTHYAYRVHGPWRPMEGLRFNPRKVLIDPFARGNTNNLWDRVDACGPHDNIATSMRSVVVDLEDYDWEGDETLKRPMRDSVVYEMHVGGFTKSPTSGVAHPGTYQGVIEKIPYLRELGVTAVELLPVMEFDEKEILSITEGGETLKNYWGYSTLSFFAPHGGYAVGTVTGQQIREFRDMVKALHQAGIEVLLDVVFNHTNEGNHQGPTINFKGINNKTFYHLVNDDPQYYMDYSGCGNTVNCNHPIVEKFILECLRFWTEEMHVDGFRFDEGSILSRGEDGAPMRHPPVLWNIELSDALADTKVIAEAWDAAGLYQIGYFPGYRWAEWNGKYRDTIRRFVKGDPGLVGDVASRMGGSSDIYEFSGHLPINSINFVDCHDGFTLNDLVSYNEKHNAANGEGNGDGINDNLSWNCGVEGETDQADVEQLRSQQIKNFCSILLLSQGVPMILMGDEVRRTQKGNNNAYCQDNEISWMDWSQAEKNAGVLRFFQKMIAFRKEHRSLRRKTFFNGGVNARGLADIAWHGPRLGQPGWSNPEARALAFTLGGIDGDADLHVMMNMHWEAISFEVPKVDGHRWYRVVDTTRAAPEDFAEAGQETEFKDDEYLVGARGVVVLLSRPASARVS